MEKKQHEQTNKHQNSIQRSLRELHKGKERDDREKQRAKDEVARLNGLVGSKSASNAASNAASTASSSKVKSGLPTPVSAPARATPEERKRQMAQLAAMGVAVPEEYRRDMSIAGDWSTVSERVIYAKPEIKDEDEESKPAVGSFGVRKRKLDDEEEEDEQAAVKARKNWGSTLKAYPGAKENDDDLDALLDGPLIKKESRPSEVKREEPEDGAGVKLKKEVSNTIEQDGLKAIPDVSEPAPPNQEQESAAGGVATEAPVLFKKRKGVKR